MYCRTLELHTKLSQGRKFGVSTSLILTLSKKFDVCSYVIELDDALYGGNIYSKNVPVTEKYYICKSYKKFIC